MRVKVIFKLSKKFQHRLSLHFRFRVNLQSLSILADLIYPFDSKFQKRYLER